MGQDKESDLGSKENKERGKWYGWRGKGNVVVNKEVLDICLKGILRH